MEGERGTEGGERHYETDRNKKTIIIKKEMKALPF
jgi:hypothetical protein